MDDPVDAQAFRQVMRAWSSGVAVVTSAADGVLHGMTVSSFTSVSLNPPLVLVCCDDATRTLELITHTQVFAVSVLASDQAEVSSRFASEALEDVRFDGQAFTLAGNGCPLLTGACAHFACSLFAGHPAGDHTLIVGKVTQAELFPRPPLLYHDAGYGDFLAKTS